MSEKETAALQQVWSSMLSASLKQTLILSWLNRKFPGAIKDMAKEFAVISEMLEIHPEIGRDVTHTLSGMPEINEENNPFRILSNEIMTGAVIQTLVLRYFMTSDPGMARSMLDDFGRITPAINLNETVRERVISLISEFLPQ